VEVKGGQGENEGSDIVTRAESTPKKKVGLQGVNLYNYTRATRNGEQKTKGMKSEDPLTVTQYPVRDI
jgi:hypothetical protein